MVNNTLKPNSIAATTNPQNPTQAAASIQASAGAFAATLGKVQAEQFQNITAATPQGSVWRPETSRFAQIVQQVIGNDPSHPYHAVAAQLPEMIPAIVSMMDQDPGLKST